MRELNERAKHLLERKIEEVVNRGDISPSEMDCVYKAYKTIYYMTTTEAMNEYGDSRSFGRSMYPDWDFEESMRRGRGMDGRFVSRNDGRSYHSVNDRIIASLERELNGDISDFERQRITDEIRRLREMKD